MNRTEMAKLLAAIATFDNRDVNQDTVILWHAAIGELDFTDAQNAIIRHFANSGDYLMPHHVKAGVKKIRTERAAELGDVDAGHSSRIPIADPDDPHAYLAALRAGHTYDADDLAPTGRPVLALVVKELLPAGEEAPSLKDRPMGPLGVECPTCQAPIGRQCHTNAKAGAVRREKPHGARRRAVQDGLDTRTA